MTLCHHHHHQCRLRELECTGRESRGQTLRPSVPLQDARVAMRSELESEHMLTPTPAVSRLRSVSKQLQKTHSVGIEEVRCCTRHSQKSLREMSEEERKLAVPQELKDMSIPPDSDPRKRRAIKAGAAVVSSASSQMEGSRAVAETPTQQNSTTDESRMDVEGGETNP